MIVSILVYIPAGKIADRIGRKPFVIVTFRQFCPLSAGDYFCDELWLSHSCL